MGEEKQAASGIIRVQHDKTRPFFVMSRALAEDDRLSYAARGMMCYLLSKPDDWELRMGDLIKNSPGGLRHVRAILHELSELGYLRRTREKTTGGRFVWTTTVYESPSVQNVSMDEPSAQNASMENVPIQNASMQNVPIYQEDNGPSTKRLNNNGGGDPRARATATRTPPPPLRDEQDESSAAWLKSLDLYPSQIASALAKHPVFTPEERTRCEAWIKRQNFPKAHVSLHKQYLSLGKIPDAPPSAKRLDAAAAAIEAERIAGLARWERENARGY